MANPTSRLKSLCALLLLLGSAPLSALADDVCSDLWFSRNAILAKAGACIASPLGDAVFDNKGCNEDAPDLPDAIAVQVATISEREIENACDLDTEATTLELWQIENRRALDIQPIHSGTESACVLRAPTRVLSAPDPEAETVGWLDRGDMVLLQHDEVGGVSYASRVIRGTLYLDLVGWFGASQCKLVAG